MIVYGTRKAGYCDSIPGLGHVMTQFAHVWFVPLIPLKSYFVFEEDEDRGIEIPMRGKSVLSAWIRTGFILGGLGALVGGVVGLGSNVLSGMVMLVGAVACFAAFWFSGRLFEKMSDDRRAELMNDTGLGELLAQQLFEQMEELEQQEQAAAPFAEYAQPDQSYAQPDQSYAPAAQQGYAQPAQGYQGY